MQSAGQAGDHLGVARMEGPGRVGAVAGRQLGLVPVGLQLLPGLVGQVENDLSLWDIVGVHQLADQAIVSFLDLRWDGLAERGTPGAVVGPDKEHALQHAAFLQALALGQLGGLVRLDQELHRHRGVRDVDVLELSVGALADELDRFGAEALQHGAVVGGAVVVASQQVADEIPRVRRHEQDAPAGLEEQAGQGLDRDVLDDVLRGVQRVLDLLLAFEQRREAVAPGLVLGVLGGLIAQVLNLGVHLDPLGLEPGAHLLFEPQLGLALVLEDRP